MRGTPPVDSEGIARQRHWPPFCFDFLLPPPKALCMVDGGGGTGVGSGEVRTASEAREEACFAASAAGQSRHCPSDAAVTRKLESGVKHMALTSFRCSVERHNKFHGGAALAASTSAVMSTMGGTSSVGDGGATVALRSKPDDPNSSTAPAHSGGRGAQIHSRTKARGGVSACGGACMRACTHPMRGAGSKGSGRGVALSTTHRLPFRPRAAAHLARSQAPKA